MTVILNIILLVICSFVALGASQPETLAIFTYKVAGAHPWDPDTVKSGLTGSEEAVVYVSQNLAALGYAVTVVGDPPAGSVYSAVDSNPRFVNFDYDDGTIYDIAIAWRTPGNAELLKKRARFVYLWPHDTYDSRLSSVAISAFDDVLWLSKWQREYWIRYNPEFAPFTQIIGNGIDPAQFKPVQERKNPLACIYGSNYSRGLETLLDIWPQIKSRFPKATLDLYYGWQHWGLLSPEKEAKMRYQVQAYKKLDVVDHGLVGHDELTKAYQEASLWTYPCFCPEVFCITAIKAQLAGAVPVIVQGSALSETVRHGYSCGTSAEYFETLCQALKESEEISLSNRQKMGEFVLQEYTWRVIAEKWQRLFNDHKNLKLCSHKLE